MNSVLYQLIVSQIKIFFREPGLVFWSFLFPVMMAWVLGIAFANKGEPLRSVALVPEGPGSAAVLPNWLLEKTGATAPELVEGSEQLEWSVEGQPGAQAHFRFRVLSREEAALALKRGQISLWIEGSPETGMHYRFDPESAEARLTYLLLESAFQEQAPATSQAEVRPLTTVGSRYIDFLIPGLMGMTIMNACLWGIGWTLIDLRIKKLLRRMVATPLRKSVFLLSHGLNRMMFSATEMLLLYGFALLYFDITIQGSLLALAVVFLGGYLAFAGIAILISCRVQNPQSGNGLINAVMMPMFIVSGIFFSYHQFPDWIIPFVEPLPLTLLVNALRSIITEGADIAHVLPSALGLAGIGGVCFLLGLRFYRWH